MSEGLKSTQIVLNTSNYISGSTNNDAKYSIDWNTILKPNTPYKMAWSYIGGQNVYNGTKPALLTIDMNMDVFEAGTNFGAKNSNVIGFLAPVIIQPGTNTVYLTAQLNTNEPVYLERRPLNSTFNVKIVDVNGNLWTDNDATPQLPANWVMTLVFTEAERA